MSDVSPQSGTKRTLVQSGRRHEKPSPRKTTSDDAARAHWRLHARLRGRLAGRGARDGLLVVGATSPTRGSIAARLRVLAARGKYSNASALSASATVGAEHSLASSTHRFGSSW